MQILITVISTLLLVGILIVILLGVTSITLMNNMFRDIVMLKSLTTKYMHDQQTLSTLFVQLIGTTNNLTDAVDSMMYGGSQIPPLGLNGSQESWMDESEPELLGPVQNVQPETLSDDEIKMLQDLLTTEDEETEDGKTQ